MKESTHANKEVKDRVFKLIFQNPVHALELFNALNGTDFKDPSKLEINTLENVMFYSLENDLSFVMDNKMNLYEQQSTQTANMPYRFLGYITELYSKYLGESDRKKYSNKRIMLPAPTFTVFYNGTQEAPDKEVMKLSSSFLGMKKDEIPSLELIVQWYNVNNRRNKDLLDKCKALSQYAWMSDTIYAYRMNGYDLTEAVIKMIEKMPKDFVIYEEIMKNKSQVITMWSKEYDEKLALEVSKEEGYEDGHEDGELDHAKKVALSMLNEELPEDFILRHAGISQKDLDALKEEHNITKDTSKSIVKIIPNAKYDEKLALQVSKEEGYEDGFEEGHEDGKLEQARIMALSMLNEELPEDFILRHTGITQKDLDALKEEHNITKDTSNNIVTIIPNAKENDK